MQLLYTLPLRVLFACVFGLAVAGCGESDGPAEKAGQEIDHAVESTTDSVSDAMTSTGNAMTDAAEDAKDSMSDAMDKTGEAMKDTGETTSEAVGLKD
jgi:ElaB/YqjD/DUF883 family membrane-anchored ribosome-binding protein